jgi:hypothetical protein
MATRKWLRALAPLALAASVASVSPAWADSSTKPLQLVPAEVVAVSGTPNLYLADAQGMAHFTSDPIALADQTVNWNERTDITPDQVELLPLGAPYLSMALVQIGHDIYLPQWNPTFHPTMPTLQRVQSPHDLAMLGIDASNYGQYVLDSRTWEQRYNLSIARVEFAGDFQLVPAPPAPEPTPEPAAPPTCAESETGTVC